MNISLRWLRDYVEIDRPAEALADLLTMAGLEVEEVTRTGPHLDGVVVGHVVQTREHPNADRLTLCDVDLGPAAPTPETDTGRPETVQIVCGAPNVAAGQKVPVATVGTTLMLPNRKTGELQAVTLGEVTLRGETSRGMICAEDELSLGDNHDGILVLDDDAPVGQPLEDYLQDRGAYAGDVVFDIAITPNRPDAISHLGVARDVAALTERPLTPPEVETPEVGGAAAEAVSVRIEATDECARFAGMVIRGVTVGESPAWLKGRLEAVGLRPISNVVDITNYVMLEMGQPLHAYDLDTLADREVVVKTATGGETFTTLDGTQRTLPEGAVMVADGQDYLGIAGIMGGLESEVTEATTAVFLEGAYWEPTAIRRTAKALGMQTDASYRFERGVDPTRPLEAVARAATLIAEISGGKVMAGAIDEHPRPAETRTVRMRPERARRVLGTDIETDEMVRLLRAIGFEVDDTTEETLDAFAEETLRGARAEVAVESAERYAGLQITIPPFRPDVEREIDVVEEVARLYGYDRIPRPRHTPISLSQPRGTDPARLLDRARDHLAALGMREMFSNSLVPKAVAERFAEVTWTGRPASIVETLNPISREMAALRPSLLHGLVQAAAYNQARGRNRLRLFETGRVFVRAQDPAQPVEGYREHTSLILGISGAAAWSGWSTDERAVDLFDLKGFVEALCDDLWVTDLTETPRSTPTPLTAYAVELHAADGTRLGLLARLAETLMDDADLQAPLFVAELDADALVARSARRRTPHYTPIRRVPAVERDLAVTVPEKAAVGPMLATIRKAAGELLLEARLFDLYAGEHVEAGTKSVAFALRFGAARTLTDAEVEARVDAVQTALKAEHGAELRR